MGGVTNGGPPMSTKPVPTGTPHTGLPRDRERGSVAAGMPTDEL
jgi:hypothetical protein